MAIVQTILQYQFIDMMQTARPNNFSVNGLRVLFDYLDELSDDCSEPMEFDAIAIACDYSEADAVEVYNRYKPDLNLDDEDQALFDLYHDTDLAYMLEDIIKAQIIEYLEYNTRFVGETKTGSLVFADF